MITTKIYPTMHLQFVDREGKKILQQRWDSALLREGKWETYSEWKDIPHVGDRTVQQVDKQDNDKGPEEIFQSR